VDKNITVTPEDYQAMSKNMARLDEENKIFKKAMSIFAKR
jgi:hypothetical protein